MAVLVKASEKLCKICQHLQRPEIDALLEVRSQRGVDENGNRVNLQYVLARLAEWGMQNPTEENVKNHWQKHCTVVDSKIAREAQAEAAEKVIAILTGKAKKTDINSDLDKLWAIGMAELEARISRGDRSGISPDLMMKIAAEKTRRQHNETQDTLLRTLAGGISAALGGGGKAIGEASIVAELEPVDAEFAEVES